MMSVQTNLTPPDLKGKDFLTLADHSAATIETLLKKASEMKSKPEKYSSLLKGKILGMIFEKPSTRTRVSFEAGMLQLGGHALYLNRNDLQLGRGETIADTAKVLSQYVDAIMIRTFSHSIVEELAYHAEIPVINGLTDLSHPCQVLADLLTIQEIKGTLRGLKLVYIGDGNNVAHSLLIGAAKMGIDVAVASPQGYEPNSEVVSLAKAAASENGSEVHILHDPYEAVIGADVLYSDVWTSMGQEQENQQRLEVFKDFQVNEQLVKNAKDDFLFLHCLPAHRGEEVTAEIIDGSHSGVFQQAGNRLHVQKALLAEILK
jgi:ornithine carbamoyltransferase